MPSSVRKPNDVSNDLLVVAEMLRVLPEEINGGIIAALAVNILYRYGMESEWPSIDQSVRDAIKTLGPSYDVEDDKVLMN